MSAWERFLRRCEGEGSLTVSLTPAEVDELKIEACREKAYWPRVSLRFALTLLMRFYARLDYFPILDAIDALEGGDIGITKRASKFKRPPLKGLWHVHWTSADHLLRNIGEHWKLGRPASSASDEKLVALIEDIASKHGDEPDVRQAVFSHELIMRGWEERAATRRATGEWVVFGKNEGKNYYLGLGVHADGRDQKFYDGLRQSCASEFPFIFSTTKDD